MDITIKEIRELVKMSQRQFSKYFGIPLGSLRNWEQGISRPPKYVIQMIFTSIRRDKMINIETIKFMKMLGDIAEQTLVGIQEFSKATSESYHEQIFYDLSKKDDKGRYKVVLDACVIDDKDCYHHDVISYYDDVFGDYIVRVEIDEENKPFVIVSLLGSEEEIIIEDGKWYFC